MVINKEETVDILENLERRQKIKKLLIVSIISVLLVIIIFIGFSAYFYFKSPEKTLGLGANIEQALLSQDGKISYVKLLGGSLDKNITKIKFVFTDEQGKEYVYETSEGIKEIEVPFKRSFWDWLLGRQLKGVYDYEINSDEIGIENFNNINEVGVLFEYVTSEGTALNTTILDTAKPTNQTATGGGGGGGNGNDRGTTCTDTCTSLGYECGTQIVCGSNVDCGNCSLGFNCTSNKCINNSCIITNLTYSFSCYNNKVYYFDNCGGLKDIKQNCSDGCENGDCIIPFVCIPGENCFYVNVTSSVNANGSRENPFNLSQAQAYANIHLNDEITFLMESGNYGDFSLTDVPNRTTNKWVTWKANGNAIFERIYITNSVVRDAYLKFDGINIQHPAPNPLPPDDGYRHDQDANAPGYLVFIKNVDYVQLLNGTYTGYSKYLSLGVYPWNCDNVIIRHCEISQVTGGGIIDAHGCNNLIVRDNYLHDTCCAGGVRTNPLGATMPVTLIENNHIFLPVINTSDVYFPHIDASNYYYYSVKNGNFITGETVVQDATGATAQITAQSTGLLRLVGTSRYPDGSRNKIVINKSIVGQTSGANTVITSIVDSTTYHPGSHISIRTSNTTIRKNIVHGGAMSQVFNTYTNIENIVVENNLFYDCPVVKIGYCFGTCVIRNNIGIGALTNIQLTPDYIISRYRGYPLRVILKPGDDGAGLSVYNNIAVGEYITPDPTNESLNFTEDYNIQWKGYILGENVTKGAHSKIVTWEVGSTLHGWYDYFEDIGYETNTDEYTHVNPPQAFFVDPDYRTSHDYGHYYTGNDKTWDYHLAPGSPGINFGATQIATWQQVLSGQVTGPSQPPDSLGSLGPDGFIRDDGPARDAEHHSVGCYEYVEAPAQNTFYVSVSGGTTPHNGSIGHEFNLSDAQRYANNHTNDEITFLLENGNYGNFTLINAPARTNWVTYKAITENTTTLTSILIQNTNVSDSYIIFDGFNIRNGNQVIWKGAVESRKANHIRFYNLDIEGCEGIDIAPQSGVSNSYPAIHINGECNDIIINNSKIYTPTDSIRYGHTAGVRIYNSSNVEVSNCDISNSMEGITIGSSKNIIIKNNNIHNLFSDGIFFGGCDNLTIENNEIHGLHLYIPLLVENTTETIWNENGTIMTNPNAKWNTPGETLITKKMEIQVVSGINSLIGEGEQHGDSLNFQVANVSQNGTQITLYKGIANGGRPQNVTYYIKSEAHCDLIQAGRYDIQSNVIIRGNKFYDSSGTFWWITPSVDSEPKGIGGHNFIFENNLLWRKYTTGITPTFPSLEDTLNSSGEYQADTHISDIDGAIIRNNTIIGRLTFTESGHSITNVSLYNNIVSYISISNRTNFTGGGNDYNLFNHGHVDNSISLGANTVFLNPGSYNWDKWNASEFTDIFVNYYAGDFHPSMSSIACNGSVVPKPGYVGALPCVPCEEGSRKSCATGFPGICALGNKTCSGGIYGSCIANINPSEQLEICDDNLDNDCDGKADCIDEDCFSFATCEGKQGLIFYLPLDGNANDSSPYHFNGVWYGNESYSDRVLGQAALFNGNSYINVGTHSEHEGMSELTLMAWVKPVSFSTVGNIISKQNYAYRLRLMNSAGPKATIGIYWRNETGGTLYYNSPSQIVELDKWSHVAVTYNGSVITYYFNGAKNSSTSWGGDIPSPNTILIIGSYSGSSEFFNGSIDEVMIYNRALNETEIQQIYNNQLGGVPSLSPFTRLWSFLKSILTGKTGKAILTGKITGNAVNETNENGEFKVPCIILSLFAVIILIIAVIIMKIKKNKKKSKKKIGKRIGKRR